MRNPPNLPTEPDPTKSFEMLTSLGFGPDTVLMNDPKLFVDGRFLASLLVELQDELGPRNASLVLFQIGLLHGLRDAARVCHEHDDTNEISDNADTTALVMQWAAGAPTDTTGNFSLEGIWPERHEAVARCARLGAPSDPACWVAAAWPSKLLASAPSASSSFSTPCEHTYTWSPASISNHPHHPPEPNPNTQPWSGVIF